MSKSIEKRVPKPRDPETPIEYSSRVQEWYYRNFNERPVGQIFTPEKLARYMASRIPATLKISKVLDPGAGIGTLSCAFIERAALFSKVSSFVIDAVEIDQKAAYVARAVLSYARDWAKKEDLEVSFRIIEEDFIDYALDRGGLLEKYDQRVVGYDVVIMNPPYFKVKNTSQMVEKSRKAIGTNSNAYTLFLALSVELLRKGGYIVSVSPRSFLSGRYFESFRKRFFENISPVSIHIFESRRQVFKDANVQQEIIVFTGRKKTRDVREVSITSSFGIEDVDVHDTLKAKIDSILSNNYDRRLALPMLVEDIETLEMVQKWEWNLSDYGIQISTGPVVPFRSRELIMKESINATKIVPLLWMQNVLPMNIEWPLELKKPQYMYRNGGKKPIVRNGRYVLLRRFISKDKRSRLTAATIPDNLRTFEFIGIENHVNVLHKNWSSLDEDVAMGLSMLLNSKLISRFFHVINGTTQVNAYDINLLPLPDPRKLRELGQEGIDNPKKWQSLSQLDVIVKSALFEN